MNKGSGYTERPRRSSDERQFMPLDNADLQSCRILVIDDEPANVDLLKRVLNRHGFDSVEATTDALAGLALFNRLRPHVLLLDLRMPGLDGFGVLETLSSDLAEFSTSVIVLSGEGDQSKKLQALRLGARDYITKPFDHSELLARVRSACELQELQRRLRNQNERLENTVKARTLRLEEAVTVLRQAETKLQNSLSDAQAESTAKDMMLAEAAHDLRSPLNAICGFSEVIRDERMGPAGNPLYVEYAGEIHRAARHVLSVVVDVLDLSRLQAGVEHLNVIEVSVGDAVQASVAMLQPQAAEAGVDLSVRIPGNPVRVHTDATKLQRILINIASNAIKFTPSGGAVTVEVAPDPDDGGALILIVRDTGIGIAPEHIPTILRPFGRVAGGSTKDGTGLGMPISKALVESLGGEMRLSSEPGRGTCVEIRIPQDARTRGTAAPADQNQRIEADNSIATRSAAHLWRQV